ncbi:MAG: SOS response-associated peptidase [Gemmatimonadaceae bacterium]
MCGRSSLHDAPVSVLERFSLPPVLPGFEPRYNIAPTQNQWTIALDTQGVPTVAARRWGLIPWWANDPAIGNRMINARSDSLADKPAFRDPVRERRCLVLADGYYEWTGTGKSRVPFFFHMRRDVPFVMAGLWDRWGRGDESVETCTVITTDASSFAARYHHRMPALLALDDGARWVDSATPLTEALTLLKPFESEDLECHEVSRFVNSPANDSPECIQPVSRLV